MNAQEQRLRAELLAESELIGPDSLRPLELHGLDRRGSAPARRSVSSMPGNPRRLRLAFLAPVAAAASVALIAAAVAVVSHHGPPGGREPLGAGRPTAGQLRAVDVLSASDAWAVGYLKLPRNHGVDQGEVPLIVHWNGRTWRRVAEPVKPGSRNELRGIAGNSPGNLWAVGVRNSGSGNLKPLITRWNGHGWRVQEFPATEMAGTLTAVTVASPTDAWAVGQNLYHGTGPLIMHWNGRTWNRVPVPASPNNLLSVAAVSADNVWAVGASDKNPEILHWNGTSWAWVQGPHSALDQPVLWSVNTSPDGTVWAAGFTDGRHVATLFLRWTGSGWQRVPGPKGRQIDISAIDVLSGRDIWAAGGGLVRAKTVFIHWDGTAWTRTTAPGSTFRGGITGLAALSDKDIWATGFRGSDYAGVPQILHWNGSTWTRVYGPASTKGLYENSSCGPYCPDPTPSTTPSH